MTTKKKSKRKYKYSLNLNGKVTGAPGWTQGGKLIANLRRMMAAGSPKQYWNIH